VPATIPVEHEIAEQYVCALYRRLFNREPDSEGLSNWTAFLIQSGAQGFKGVLEGFVESEEYKRRYMVTSLQNKLEGFREFNFESLDDHVLNSLFEKTAHYWRTNASDPEEMYWSVLTNPDYKGKLAASTKDRFLSTGRGDFERIERICRLVGYDLKACKSYLEYGCGVGRLVVNLPASIGTVNCVDFSAAHLNEARRNINRKNCPQAFAFYQIESWQDLRCLPRGQDVIHSCIVLQHNTPPVIERTIAQLLQMLALGGLAVLHVPIAKANYDFGVNTYLVDEESGRGMEMHILPKANLYRLASLNGCQIVYSCCDGGCGEDVYSEFVVFRKRGFGLPRLKRLLKRALRWRYRVADLRRLRP